MAQWHFRNLHPNENSGTSTVEDNFANEERTSVEILVRETLQNPLDARHGDDVVRVRYNLVSANRASSVFAKALFSNDFGKHASGGKLGAPGDLPEIVDFLVVEDFGTTGLEGHYEDSSIDGSSENWNAFWFREGEGAKPTKSNGGAGQGKVTLYTTSRLRTVLALTKRASDQKTLLLGCCKFRQNYKLPHETGRWAKEALWGVASDTDGLVVPIEDETLLGSVQSELSLKRLSECGTTFIVPLPNEVTLQAIKTAVVNEFYYPIKRGRLQVEVGDEVIDTNTVTALAKRLGDGVRHAPLFLSFVDDAIAKHVGDAPTATAQPMWSRDAKLSETSFRAPELESLRQAFRNSETVSVDFPVQIRRKDLSESVQGIFRVVLQQDLDGEHSHELFVRQDLCIDGEKRLKGSRRIQPVIALTLIDDLALSSFLAAAEEPTHRLWNARRPKLLAQYLGPDKVLNAVRNAALRLVEFLTPPGLRDDTALSIYFADPTAPAAKRKGASGKTATSPVADPIGTPEIPVAKPKLIDLVTLKDGFRLRLRTGDDVQGKLPLTCHVEVAYATTFGDPFSQWDAADFWLNDQNLFRATSNGVAKLGRDGNVVRFEMTEPNAVISLVGFDTNRQLELRINYQETNHATNIADN